MDLWSWHCVYSKLACSSVPWAAMVLANTRFKQKILQTPLFLPHPSPRLLSFLYAFVTISFETKKVKVILVQITRERYQELLCVSSTRDLFHLSYLWIPKWWMFSSPVSSYMLHVMWFKFSFVWMNSCCFSSLNQLDKAMMNLCFPSSSLNIPVWV